MLTRWQIDRKVTKTTVFFGALVGGVIHVLLVTLIWIFSLGATWGDLPRLWLFSFPIGLLFGIPAGLIVSLLSRQVKLGITAVLTISGLVAGYFIVFSRLTDPREVYTSTDRLFILSIALGGGIVIEILVMLINIAFAKVVHLLSNSRQ